MMKLSRSGARTVATWFGGAEVAHTHAEASLAGRLLATGMAHRTDTDQSLTFAVVIPVREDSPGLARTLKALGTGQVDVHVVHDSEPEPMGPAAARNLGATRTEADVIVFVDAGVEINSDTVRRLAASLVGKTVAGAPRIKSTPTAGLIGAYETNHSPLDLGPLPGIARTGSRISYVPSTVLAVRRSAFEAVGGFNLDMRYGEDVDLVWRLAAIGDIKYMPSLVAQHPPRETVRAFVQQRFNYGTAAAPLAMRHGNNVAPVALSGWSIATIALLLVPMPTTLLLWLGGLSFGLSKKMPEPAPLSLAVDATLRGNFAAAESVAKASTRVWWPLALAALASPLKLRIVMAWVWSWSKHRTWLGLFDDVAYGAGVWRGTLRAKTARSVLPRLVVGKSQSKRSRS